ncbi:MAG: WcbI family polysaccharide biosynthesis putative acetyltransferase [Roseiarcus sp.]
MIVVYGNCQAGVYADLLTKVCPREEPVRYIMNFAHPTEAGVGLDEAEKASVRLILRQTEVREMPQFEQLKELSQTIPMLRFAALDFNVLWPFNFMDPRNVSEPPDFPFGRFPYGDRIVVELLREGSSGDDLWREYQTRSVAKMPNLDRLLEVEAKRLEARDADSDFKIACYVLNNFRSQQLFWTLNHPSGLLLGKQFGDLLSATFATLGVAKDGAEMAAKMFATYEPFGAHHVPIHPEAAKRLGLTWYVEGIKFKYLDGRSFTFEETMRNYIAFKS